MFSAWISEIVPDADGSCLQVTVMVSKIGEEVGAPTAYGFDFDPVENSIGPHDNLAECFDVYSEHETADGLNPRLRRLWLTASLVDTLASRLVKSKAFKVVTAEAAPVGSGPA